MGDKTLLDRVIDLECAVKVLKEEFCRFKAGVVPAVNPEPMGDGLREVVDGLVERARLEDERKARIAERMRKARAGRKRVKGDG